MIDHEVTTFEKAQAFRDAVCQGNRQNGQALLDAIKAPPFSSGKKWYPSCSQSQESMERNIQREDQKAAPVRAELVGYFMRQGMSLGVDRAIELADEMLRTFKIRSHETLRSEVDD
jgi:hypothetical protein